MSTQYSLKLLQISFVYYTCLSTSYLQGLLEEPVGYSDAIFRFIDPNFASRILWVGVPKFK
jgi:hypothetical protein